MKSTVEREVSDLVGCLTDPIIVFPGGWGSSLPEWLKSVVPLDRMIVLMQSEDGREPTAADAEACAYLMTVSLSQPMDRDWTDTYLYVAGRTCKRWEKVDVSADITVESLNEYQTNLLAGLKAWLYRQRVAARSGTHRAGMLAKPPLPPEDEQPALFKF